MFLGAGERGIGCLVLLVELYQAPVPWWAEKYHLAFGTIGVPNALTLHVKMERKKTDTNTGNSIFQQKLRSFSSINSPFLLLEFVRQ